MSIKGLVHGAGVNDSDYPVNTIDGNGTRQRCKFYSVWKCMLQRVYSEKYHARYPTYSDTKVCEQWHSFMVFRAWMIDQDWEGKELDKDVLVPMNKIYGPDFCLFVTPEVNHITLGLYVNHGEYPRGVSFDKSRGKFIATCFVENKQKNLGRYQTQQEAINAYAEFKIERILDIASRQYDSRVSDALLEHALLVQDRIV